MDIMNNILSPVIVGVVLGLLGWLAAKRQDVRIWFVSRPWAIGAITGLVAAGISSWIFAVLLSRPGSLTEVPIKITRKISTNPILDAGNNPAAAFASCGDDVPISGACILNDGNLGSRQIQNIGVALDFHTHETSLGNGYLCLYTGGQTTHLTAIAYCVDKKKMELVP